MHPVSLKKLPRVASHHLDILYRGFATEAFCHIGTGAHGNRKGHALKSGTAYFAMIDNHIRQLGPICAKDLGKQKLHMVPDLTREAVAPAKDDDENQIRSGPLIRPPIEFNEKQHEEEERAKDIEYLMLRGEILPGHRARERLSRKLKPLANDTQDRPLIRLLQQFKINPEIELGEVRRIRDYADHGDPKNGFTRLHRNYVAQVGIERCLKSRGTTTAEVYNLHKWDRTLAETRALDTDSVRALNTILRRVAPTMPLSKEDGLEEILMQNIMFDGVGQGIGNHKLHVMLPSKKSVAPPVQQKLFG